MLDHKLTKPNSNLLQFYGKCQHIWLWYHEYWKNITFVCFILGTLITSPTVHLAFDETYYLERACTNIVKSLSAVGGNKEKLKHMPQKLKEFCAQYFTENQLDLYAKRHFYSYWNLYMQNEPDVFSWVFYCQDYFNEIHTKLLMILHQH